MSRGSRSVRRCAAASPNLRSGRGSRRSDCDAHRQERAGDHPGRCRLKLETTEDEPLPESKSCRLHDRSQIIERSNKAGRGERWWSRWCAWFLFHLRSYFAVGIPARGHTCRVHRDALPASTPTSCHWRHRDRHLRAGRRRGGDDREHAPSTWKPGKRIRASRLNPRRGGKSSPRRLSRSAGPVLLAAYHHAVLHPGVFTLEAGGLIAVTARFTQDLRRRWPPRYWRSPWSRC